MEEGLSHRAQTRGRASIKNPSKQHYPDTERAITLFKIKLTFLIIQHFVQTETVSPDTLRK